MERAKLSFNEAREAVTCSNVFTTHTPVPAGNEVFPCHLVERYFGPFCQSLGISIHELMALGRMDPRNEREEFCLTVLALRLAQHCNGVSRLHGEVSRRMWKSLWPNIPLKEVPITSVTNGIHSKSWISMDMSDLFDRYLGPRWITSPADHSVWERIDTIPAGELWRTHERRRERLVAFARKKLKDQLTRRGASHREIQHADEVLNPEALTIGFARRFATYKRANLIFRDFDRLIRILSDRKQPVQFIFAGKAHPRDNEGKEIIRQIVETARDEKLRDSIVFIEDYDMSVARYLVSGVDIWLNNPRRPLEASGTSGMKASANGVINMSVLDGWWVEAYDNNVGWAIGNGEEYDDLGMQDEVESKAIYDLLEQEIIPLFYNRGNDGLPRGWVDMMKYSMRTICPVFNTNRMVQEYSDRFYRKSHELQKRMLADNLKKARKLASWKRRMIREWHSLRIEDITSNTEETMRVGGELEVYVHVHLGEISPDDVSVEIYQGPLDPRGMIDDGRIHTMSCCNTRENGMYTFVGTVPCWTSGLHGYTIRILPKHEDMCNQFEPNLVTWGA
jgi:starch phosphorylase